MNLSDLKIYLPKFLSEDSEKALIKSIRDFPKFSDSNFYTEKLKEDKIVYQGDGFTDLIAINLPDTDIKKVSAIVLSNTCDIDPENKRFFPSRIVYSPIVPLESYKRILVEEGKTTDKIENHFKSIRNQEITQIFYLPSLSNVISESIVFLDHVYSLPNNYIKREKIEDLRLFALSNFGNYLFLFKISIHFTRIQDKVDRGQKD